jgi:hypothetical protein
MLQRIARRVSGALHLAADLLDAFLTPPEPKDGVDETEFDELVTAVENLDGPLTTEGEAMLAPRIPRPPLVPADVDELVGSVSHRRKNAMGGR